MTNKHPIPIKVVLADDNELFREGFRVMLKKQSEIELVGESENGIDLIQLVKDKKPDVIITDIKMPEMDGVEATKRIRRLFPGMGIIAFTMFDDDTLIVDMLEAGARGYLLKNAAKSEIYEAIKTVHNNGAYYCNSTNTRLAKLIGESKFNPYKKHPKPALTEREMEIMRMVCRELSNKEIAQTMFMSIRTVEGYREKIQRKIGARNSIGMVIFSIKNGIYKIGAINES